MKQEELLRLNICPFDKGAMVDGMDGEESEAGEKAHFILVLRYLVLLVQQCQEAFRVPCITECLTRKECVPKSYRYYTEFTRKRQEIMEHLQKEFLLNSGWSYGRGSLNQQKVSGVAVYSRNNCSLEDWRNAALQIPQIFDVEEKGFSNVSITVFWNERIARYHKYAVSNPGEVKMRFREGSVMMESILRKLADPYALGIIFSDCGEKQYVMGHFEGSSDEGVVSTRDMDYNFFVQAVILHMLLSHAEKLFGLPGWEVDYEA